MSSRDKFFQRAFYVLIAAVFSTVVLYAYSTGITGRTLKTTSEGCICHGASNTPSVNVTITGPDYMLPNSTELFTVTISGGPLVRAGVNIAASSGTLQPVSGSGLQLIGDELTHVSPKQPSGGAVTFQFEYTAPSTLGSQTIYAIGNSVNFNGSSGGDQWNWAPNKTLIVSNVIPVELSSFTAQVIANTVILNWTTSSELNNSGFEIQRKSLSASADWQEIAFVIGSGTTSQFQNYSYQDKNLLPGKYSYRIKQVDFDGSSKNYDLKGEVEISNPQSFVLNQNYPNPFNPSTVISWQSPVEGFQELKVYDALGKEMATLVSEWKEAGYHSVTFDAKNFASGIYFYKISADGFTDIKKMILMR